MNNISFDDERRKYLYDVAIMSGIGKRESQQDAGYVYADDNGVLAIVCDGMGGIAGGQIASATAVTAYLQKCKYNFDANTMSGNYLWRQNAIIDVDDIVYSLKDEDGNRMGAGTTLLSIIIENNKLYWLSVGDSRIYIIRNNEMVQVTTDHNYFHILKSKKENNEISDEEFLTELVNGEALVSYLGMGGLELIDVNEIPFILQSGDIILLCTDGMYRNINEEILKGIIRTSSDMEDVAYRIERLIIDQDLPNQDNYTYVLIQKC